MPRSNKVPKEIAKYILNCLPSPTPERDWGIDIAQAAGVHAPAAAIPPAKDLRAAWWPIGDQGSTGSCVGWGTAEGVLRWHFAKAGKLGQKEPLSARYVWMAAKETDGYNTRPTSFIEEDGTWLKAALDIARNFGVVTGYAYAVLWNGSSWIGGATDYAQWIWDPTNGARLTASFFSGTGWTVNPMVLSATNNAGQIVGKAWMVLISIPFVAWLRRRDERRGRRCRTRSARRRCARAARSGGGRGVGPRGHARAARAD